MRHELPPTLSSPGSGTQGKEPKPYSLDKVEHPLMRYRPSFLAKGGEHIVLNVEKVKIPHMPRQRDVVVKANILYARTLDKMGANNPDQGGMSERKKRYMEDLIEKDRKKYDEFRSYFGRGNVSPQRKFLMQVPVTREIAKTVFPEAATNPKEVWTVVTVQKRAKELGPEYEGKRLGIGTFYAELRPGVTPEAYANTSARLFSGRPKVQTPQKREEAMSEMDRRTHLLLGRAEEDPGLKETVTDFVRRAITYTEDTGEILDMIGTDNIVFVYDTRPDGSKEWRYKIIDGFFAKPDRRRLKNAEQAVSKLVTEGSMPEEGVSDVMNVANYVRAINAMAEQLGIPERLRVFDGLTLNTYKRMMAEVRRVDSKYSGKQAA